MSETETTALEVIPRDSALAVLTNAEKFDEFFERVAKEVRGVEPDLTTAAGRKAIAALAFKVTKSKTAIVAAADLLTEDARAQIKKVNESKKEIETRLDDLKKEVRKPLTDWEAAEEERVRRAEHATEMLRDYAIVAASDDSEILKNRLASIKNMDLSPEIYGEHSPILAALHDRALIAIGEGITRALKAEADAAELAQLRAQTAERDRQDAEREAAEAAAEQERQAEAQRKRDEEAQRERDRIAAEEAAEAARVAEEQRAERERVAEEQRAARERQIAEEAAAAERQRIADFAEAERQAAEKRAANVRHQSKIMGEAKTAIMGLFPAALPESDREAFAKLIVRGIVDGLVPHTAITF